MKHFHRSKVKCFCLGTFYEGKIDLIHVHINIFYGFGWVFLPVRQTRSWVVEQCFMACRCFSLLSLACQTLGLPHSWLSPQWKSTLRSHYSDNVKLGFPSLPLVTPCSGPFFRTLIGNVQFYSSFPRPFCTGLYFVSLSFFFASSRRVSLLSEPTDSQPFEIVIWPRHMRALEGFSRFSHCTFFSQGGDTPNKGGLLIWLARATELQNT